MHKFKVYSNNILNCTHTKEGVMSTKSYIPARSGTERLFPGAVFQAITAVIDWSVCAWDRRRQRKALYV